MQMRLLLCHSLFPNPLPTLITRKAQFYFKPWQSWSVAHFALCSMSPQTRKEQLNITRQKKWCRHIRNLCRKAGCLVGAHGPKAHFFFWKRKYSPSRGFVLSKCQLMSLIMKSYAPTSSSSLRIVKSLICYIYIYIYIYIYYIIL